MVNLTLSQIIVTKLIADAEKQDSSNLGPEEHVHRSDLLAFVALPGY